ncbi:MAG: hypothetical protein M9939_23905 [Mesorhizobium sp.]|nr:hypothetical protein [Mesorhizobium sp.]MCO5164150.1 hypothetical protein [Mesorhizobium sp.]
MELGAYGDDPSWALSDLQPFGGTSKRDGMVRDRANAILDLVGFAIDRRRRLAQDLTLAEQKITDIARALMGARSILFLDEPTAGLAEEEILHIANVLRTINRNTGVTILVIAHHIGFIRSVADYATVLDFGRKLAEGTPEEMARQPDVISVFLGESDA